MVNMKRFLCAGAIAVSCGGFLHAQTTGTTGGTTGGGGGGQASPQSSIQLVEIETPVIASTTATGGNQGAAVATSNAFGPYFANPMWQGRAGSNTGSLTTVVAPGGFGQALYGTTGVSGAAGAGGTGGARGTTANRTATGTTAARTGTTLGGTTALGGGTGGRTALGGTGLGRTTGLGGTGLGGTGRTGTFGGTNTAASQQNAALSTGRSIAYTQTLKFAAPAAVAPVQLQADLQSMISTSSTLSGVPGLQVTTADGGVVVLRGQVADADEARLVEGMIRLTPGVRDVKNELTTR